MKIANTFLASLFLVGSLGAINSAVAADGVMQKVPLNANSYCHQKFVSVDREVAGKNDPDLNNSGVGEIVDFYGPCSETPTGKDQQLQLRLDEGRHGTVFSN